MHQNQGDPPGPHQSDGGIWQDGGTLVVGPGGQLRAFLNKFKTQSGKTDDNGLPV